MTPKPTVVYMATGSHLYGLNTPKSDFDYKGIYVPTMEQLLLNKYGKTYKSSTGNPHAKNVAGDVDLEILALPRFVELAVQGENLALDMLHCKEPMLSSDVWEDLVSKRTMFYTKNLKSFVGYVRQQAAKYGVKGSRLGVLEDAISVAKGSIGATVEDIADYLPVGDHSKFITTDNPGVGVQAFYEICGRKLQTTLGLATFTNTLQKIYDNYGDRAKAAKENSGIDWKAVSHALRVGYQARDIYTKGDFEYPLEETNFLLMVKRGELDYMTQVQPVLEDLVDQVTVMAENSTFPAHSDVNYWDQWLLDVYSTTFKVDLKNVC